MTIVKCVSRFHCFYVLLLFSFYLVCRKDNVEKRFSPVTWQHTTVGSSLTTPQCNWVSWIPWQTTETQRQTIFTKQFANNSLCQEFRTTSRKRQGQPHNCSKVLSDALHTMCMTLTTKKHFGVLFLTWQRQKKKKKSFCFFLWEKELYSTRITSRCCSAFQQTRKLSGCFLLTKTLGAFVYYLSITPITFGVTQNRCRWNGMCGTSERFSPVEGSRVSQKLTTSRYIVLAQAPKVITIYVFTCNFKERKKKNKWEICSPHPSCCLLWNTQTHKWTKSRSHTHKTPLALDSVADLRGFRARQRLADWFWHFHCLPISSRLEYECGHKFPWEFNAMCAFVNQVCLCASHFTCDCICLLDAFLCI